MLTNHDMDSAALLARLLVGQPTLRRRIKPGVLATLDQRIAERYNVTGMNPKDTAGYLRHRSQLGTPCSPAMTPTAPRRVSRHSQPVGVGWMQRVNRT
jgi:type II secretory pathway predicted ATPase ExeA